MRMCRLAQAGCAYGLRGGQQADVLTLLVKLHPNIAVLLFPVPTMRTYGQQDSDLESWCQTLISSR